MAHTNQNRKISRNAPCPCGSGRKYKQCCLKGSQMPVKPATSGFGQALQRARQLKTAGHWHEALRIYQELLKRHPRHFAVLRELGQCLCADERFIEAGEMLQKAASAIPAKTPDRAWTLADLAMDLLNARQPGQAVKLARQALRADSHHPRMHYVLGLCLERLNRHEEALSVMELAHSLDPHKAITEIALARLHGRTGDPGTGVALLRDLLDRPRDIQTQGQAWREMALLLDRLGRYPEAFDAASTAGALTLKIPGFAAYARDNVKRMAAANLRGFLATLSHPITEINGETPPPVFLMGFLRSGTTLTEQVLGAHPQIVTVDESLALYRTRRELDRIVPGNASLPEKAATLTTEQAGQLRRFYRERLTLNLDETARHKLVVDKNALNTIDIALLNRLFPDARIVFALRDPRDVCISCFLQSFAPSDMTVHLLTWEGCIDLYTQLMGLWLEVRDTLKVACLETRYEDMVTDFEGQARQLLEFLGLDWHPDIPKYHHRAASRYISTPSFSDVARPVHTSAIGRWRNYADKFPPGNDGLMRFVRDLGY